MIGEARVGKYQLLVELARGGMGIVHLAVAQGPGGFNKLLILKELKPELVDDLVYLAMFREEARVAARLEHPNIVQTLEVGQDGRRHYIAMEYLQGQPLVRIRRRRTAGFTAAAELRVICEVLRGLHYAHTLKDHDGSDAAVVHRDVSPHNVFVTYDGQVKVVDFGIAKAADTEQQTQAGVFKGKAGYVAPEQVVGGTVDARTDVFAVGVMMWEAIAGIRLWQHAGDVDIFKRLIKNDIPKIRTARPDVPDTLADIVERAMAWDIGDRYTSAKDLARDLDAYLASQAKPPTLIEIGECVSSLFDVERQRLRQVLETKFASTKRHAIVADVVVGPDPRTQTEPAQPSAAPHTSSMTPPAISRRQGTGGRKRAGPARPRRTWAALAVGACIVPVALALLSIGGRERGHHPLVSQSASAPPPEVSLAALSAVPPQASPLMQPPAPEPAVEERTVSTRRTPPAPRPSHAPTAVRAAASTTATSVVADAPSSHASPPQPAPTPSASAPARATAGSPAASERQRVRLVQDQGHAKIVD